MADIGDHVVGKDGGVVPRFQITSHWARFQINLQIKEGSTDLHKVRELGEVYGKEIGEENWVEFG